MEDDTTKYYVELYDERTGEWEHRPGYYENYLVAEMAAEQEGEWWDKSWRVASVTTTYTYEEGFLPAPDRWHEQGV